MKLHSDIRRLRLLTALFFLALAVPSGVLVWQSYSRLKWETFHQHQLLADEVARRIDLNLASMVDVESARAFTDYSFLTVAGAPESNFVQRSPLAAFPVNTGMPGLVGYFQVDPRGEFSSPLLPDADTAASSVGITPEELVQRQALARQIRQVLSENQLLAKSGTSAAKLAATLEAERASAEDRVGNLSGRSKDEGEYAGLAPSDAAPGPAAFDRLNATERDGAPEKKRTQLETLGRVEDLELDETYQAIAAAPPERLSVAPRQNIPAAKRSMRKEQSALPDRQASVSQNLADRRDAQSPAVRVRMFESEVDAFEFSPLDGGYFLLYRKVWRDGDRIIQGLLIEQTAFLDKIVSAEFRATALSRMSNLIVAYQGRLVAAFNGSPGRSYLAPEDTLRGTLLYQTRLSTPLSELELIFSINRLPASAGGAVIAWTALLLALVVVAGLALMYRLSLGHIRLGQQQQDFVSAVSHELRTPLTSIRMYGEMLREGWAPPSRRQEYYAFIHDESERLSRLINNVLHLARMTRNERSMEIRAATVGELLDSIRSKIVSAIEHAGARMHLECPDALRETRVAVDLDCFTQIMINLIDNALKFSVKAADRTIDLSCRAGRRGYIEFAVRDYGPGVAPDQMIKIFQPFHRAENELTRETSGVGIGLALVQRLAQAMGARVDAINMNPGVEFRLVISALA